MSIYEIIPIFYKFYIYFYIYGFILNVHIFHMWKFNMLYYICIWVKSEPGFQPESWRRVQSIYNIQQFQFHNHEGFGCEH